VPHRLGVHVLRVGGYPLAWVLAPFRRSALRGVG
jgi:hypothetical protein